MAAPSNLRATSARIEALVDELAAGSDPVAYDKTAELLRLVTELYGAGLARLLELTRTSAPELVDVLSGDDLVSSLLLVHGLHPKSLEHRLQEALAQVSPLLSSHGGGVELLELDAEAGAVRMRLTGSCDGCPSSAVTLKSAVERAIVEAAPEIVLIDVDEPSPSGEVAVSLSQKRPSYDACPAELVSQ